MLVINEFLESYAELKAYSLLCAYTDYINPYDGINYPAICAEIPTNVQTEIFAKISNILGRELVDPIIFMRRSEEGVNAPNQVHSDKSMGDYSLMLYLNTNEGAGTSIVKHIETGIAYNPQVQSIVNIVTSDANKPEAWEVVYFWPMEENKAVIFRADSLHRAEPIGGFGKGDEARTVLTCFFK
jgi:hypothetical protein